MGKKANDDFSSAERAIHTVVDNALNAPSAATFAVRNVADKVDNNRTFTTAVKRFYAIPKFTALIVIGFF